MLSFFQKKKTARGAPAVFGWTLHKYRMKKEFPREVVGPFKEDHLP